MGVVAEEVAANVDVAIEVVEVANVAVLGVVEDVAVLLLQPKQDAA